MSLVHKTVNAVVAFRQSVDVAVSFVQSVIVDILTIVAPDDIPLSTIAGADLFQIGGQRLNLIGESQCNCYNVDVVVGQ
jgi:hypothetical protein